MTVTLEREIKLRYADPNTARRAVLSAGAKPRRARRLQDDSLLDRGTDPLREHHCTLRVRVDDGQALLTFKGAPMPGTMKVREELETTVGDPGLIMDLCARLGFQVQFRYQKYREEFQRGRLVIAVDETPVGTFVELEGNEGDILRMTTDLRRSPSDFVRDSYPTLLKRHATTRGSDVSALLFDAS